jgi:hypothetical protein
MTDNKQLAGKCGVYCGSCPVYRSYKDKDEKALLSTAISTRCTLDLINCDGCGSEQRFVLSKRCAIRKCAIEKGVDACALCKEYPCDSISLFYDDGIISVKQPELNSARIKEIGLNRWLEEIDKGSRCKNCGRHLIIGSRECPECGEPYNK